MASTGYAQPYANGIYTECLILEKNNYVHNLLQFGSHVKTTV